jgi:hypothetical protein
MLISLKHGFVFFCTPKCASNSIELMLKPHCEVHLRGNPQLRHTNFRDWHSHVRPYLAEIGGVTNLETVAVFRHPVTWLASWYRFRARYDLRSRDDPRSTANLTFAEFVEAYVANQPPAYADVGSQYDFVKTADDEIGIERLFSYQDLGALVDYFSQRTGSRLRLKALNVSPRSVGSGELLERLDSLRRRAVGALGRGSRKAGREAPPPALPEGLEARLRARIPRDFEIYQRLT